MLQGQMFPGQMSLWHLESVKDGPRNLPLNFGKNQVSNIGDIADIEFLVGGDGGGGDGGRWCAKSFSCKTQT